jgi:hypothetical protein
MAVRTHFHAVQNHGPNKSLCLGEAFQTLFVGGRSAIDVDLPPQWLDDGHRLPYGDNCVIDTYLNAFGFHLVGP